VAASCLALGRDGDFELVGFLVDLLMDGVEAGVEVDRERRGLVRGLRVVAGIPGSGGTESAWCRWRVPVQVICTVRGTSFFDMRRRWLRLLLIDQGIPIG
jgi:hypothetical protein